MQHGIREFRPRQPLDRQLSSDTLNRILRELESLRISRVVNGSFKKLPGGTEIIVAPQRGGGGSPTPATTHPFQINSFVDPISNPQSPSYLVTVRVGTINNLLPTNILDGQQLEKFALSADSLRYVVLSCTAASNTLTSCEIVLDESPPTVQTPLAFALPTTYKVVLGIVYNTTVHQLVTTNLSVSGKQAYITEKTNPSPGTLPYNVFFQWG